METENNLDYDPPFDEKGVDDGSGPYRNLFGLKDFNVLDKTMRIRLKVIDDLTDNGNKIPDSDEDRAFLISALTGADHQVIQKAKVKIASKTEEGITDLRDAVAAALMKQRVKPNPSSSQSRELPADIKPKKIVPGIMEQGYIPLTPNDLK